MSVALAETMDSPVVRLVAAPAAPSRRTPSPSTSPLRAPGRRQGPGVGPAARPRRLRFVAPPVQRPQACAVSAPAPTARARAYHLTDRGLAVVLVLAAALVAASVVVVGLTALRVTGESYHPGHVAVAPVVIQP